MNALHVCVLLMNAAMSITVTIAAGIYIWEMQEPLVRHGLGHLKVAGEWGALAVVWALAFAVPARLAFMWYEGRQQRMQD